MKKFLLITTVLSLTACSNVGKDFELPKLPEFSKQFAVDAEQERFAAAEPVKAWWNTLDDKKLTALVDDGLQHNLDIKIAVANVQQARALLDETEFARFPTVTADSSVSRERLSNSGAQGSFSDRNITNYEYGLNATWEADLFGDVTQAIEADKARLDSNEALLQGAYVSVAAEIASAYIELRGAQQRLDVAKRNTENQQKTLNLITTLAESGRSNELDVARAQSQLDQTSSRVPTFEAAVNAAVNRLSVLTGKAPEALKAELSKPSPLPSIPETVLVGDAQSLLKRRPDIRSAEAELATAIADYNMNVADLYPKISIDGSVGFLATSLSDLSTGNAFRAILGPTLSWTAFARHGVQARIDQADARAQVQVANFQKTVLTALEDVDTSMVNFAREEQSRAKLFNSAEASAKAANIAKDRYESGLDSFLDLLDTERRLLETQDALAVSEIQTALNLIAVYKALGGGWEVVEKTDSTQSQ